MKKTWKLWTAGFLLLIGITLIAWTEWPLTTLEHKVILDKNSLAVVEPALARLQIGNLPVTIQWPASVRKGDGGVINLSIPVADGTVLDNRYNFVVQSQVELPGWRVDPAEIVNLPLTSGQEHTFHWNISPDSEKSMEGVFWIYLDLVPKASETELRFPALSYRFEISVLSILGTPAWVPRWGGFVLVLTGAGIGLSFLLVLKKKPATRLKKNS